LIRSANILGETIPHEKKVSLLQPQEEKKTILIQLNSSKEKLKHQNMRIIER
jgi:hypothetical protein